jgi:hypothetical protein
MGRSQEMESRSADSNGRGDLPGSRRAGGRGKQGSPADRPWLGDGNTG